MGEMRQQFEHWAVSRHGENYVHLDLSTMKYDVPLIQSHWECWKESRAALVVELPPDLQCDGLSTGAMCNWARNQMKDHIAERLTAAGITVKGERDE